jgi:hypothetical protein
MVQGPLFGRAALHAIGSDAGVGDDRMGIEYGVEATVGRPQVVDGETLANPADGGRRGLTPF